MKRMTVRVCRLAGAWLPGAWLAALLLLPAAPAWGQTGVWQEPGDYVVAGSFRERWRADRWRQTVSGALAREFQVYRAYPFGVDDVFYRVLYGPVGYVEEMPLIEELERLGAAGAWVLRDATVTERIERVEPMQPEPAPPPSAPRRRVSMPKPVPLPGEEPPANQDDKYNLARLKQRLPER